MFVHVSRISNLQNHEFFVVFFSNKVEIKNVAKTVYFHKIKTLCSFFERQQDIFGEKKLWTRRFVDLEFVKICHEHLCSTSIVKIMKLSLSEWLFRVENVKDPIIDNLQV
jgi:hypothetical protein